MAKKWRVVKRVLGALAALVVLLAAGTAGALGWFLHRTPGNVFDSNGVPIYYTDEGEGEPVILIHGVAANADLNWRKPGVVRVLSRDFRVITMDLRGHGLSGKPTDPAQYGLEMIEDVTRLMDHLGLEKAHVAGYSLGGFLVLKLVTTHPERVRSAAVCAAGWSSLVKELDDIPAPYEKPVPVRQKRPDPEAPAAPAAPPAEGASRDSARPSPKAPNPLIDWLRNEIGDFVVGDKAPIKAMKKRFLDLTVAREEIERNQVPTLCVIGDNDGLYYLGKELGEIMGAVEYVELRGPNHLTTPADRKFKETLLDFFRGQKAG